MRFEASARNEFALEMMETIVSATEIFNTVLLDNLKKHFGLHNAFITVFDFKGSFLSLTDLNRIYTGIEHPYALIAERDICARRIIEECRRDKMWHDNLRPYLYKSSALLKDNDAQTADYIRFLKEVFHTDYMVIMPFDIDGCIHLCIYKAEGETDFSDREMEQLEHVYRYIARTFASFKRMEKPRIISGIKDEVILSGEDAYLITDINHNILSCNRKALDYLSSMNGRIVTPDNLAQEQRLTDYLLQNTELYSEKPASINGYLFRVHAFPMHYVHGMVETYHWIGICRDTEDAREKKTVAIKPLTKSEKKVAELLCEGLSYQAIAEEMFISFHTVKNHVQNIFSKYQVNSRHQFYQVYKH